MPSNRIILSPSTFSRLEQALSGHSQKRIVTQDLELSLRADELAVSFDTRIYAPKLAPGFIQFVHFLSFVAAPDTPSVRRLPRALPNGLVLHLTDVLHEIIGSLAHLSGHERLEILAALDAAKTTRAATAIQLQLPDNRRQTNQRAVGQRLAETFASDLNDLNQQMVRYRRAATSSCLEAPIARLGLQGMLADCLMVGTTRTDDGILLAEIISPSKARGNSYRMTCQLLAAVETFVGDVVPGNRHGSRCIDWDLAKSLHRKALSILLPSEKVGQARRTEMRIRGIGGRRDSLGLMPSLIDQAMTNWSGDFTLERWLDLPWLIRLTLAHLAFQRIHPFSDGNGRIGRLIMLLQLIEQGCPAIPLDLAIYRQRDAYLMAIGDAIAQEQPGILLRFLIEACQEAIQIGRSLIKALRPLRLRLLPVLRATGCSPRDLSAGTDLILSGLLLTPHQAYLSVLPDHERCLAHLIEMGLLEPISVGGSTCWRVSGLQDLIRDFLNKP